MPLRKFREASNIIHIPVWEVGGRTDELENCVNSPALIRKTVRPTMIVFGFLAGTSG